MKLRLFFANHKLREVFIFLSSFTIRILRGNYRCLKRRDENIYWLPICSSDFKSLNPEFTRRKVVHQVEMRKISGEEKKKLICTQLSLNVVWIEFFLTLKKWPGRQNVGKTKWNGFVFFAWMNMKNLIINLWIFLVCSHVLHRLYLQTENSNKSLFNFIWGLRVLALQNGKEHKMKIKHGCNNKNHYWKIYFHVAITVDHQHSTFDS